MIVDGRERDQSGRRCLWRGFCHFLQGRGKNGYVPELEPYLICGVFTRLVWSTDKRRADKAPSPAPDGSATPRFARRRRGQTARRRFRPAARGVKFWSWASLIPVRVGDLSAVAQRAKAESVTRRVSECHDKRMRWITPAANPRYAC